MPLIFVGMDRVPWSGSPVGIAISLYAVCGVVGLAVGAIHGTVLMPLTAPAGLHHAPPPL